jgi:hypothetical protein
MARADMTDLLTALLASAMEWVPDAGRNYVSHGMPVADCDTLAVWWERSDATQDSKQHCMIQSVHTLHVSRWRCLRVTADNGEPRDAALVQADALLLAADGDAIWLGIVRDWAAGDLFDEVPVPCTAISLARGMSQLPPQGEMAGWDAVIRLTW